MSEKLIEELRFSEQNRTLMRRLQRYTVNIYNKEFDSLVKNGLVEEIKDGIYALSSSLNYSGEIGLIIDEVLYEPEEYILQ